MKSTDKDDPNVSETAQPIEGEDLEQLKKEVEGRPAVDFLAQLQQKSLSLAERLEKLK